MLVATDLVPAHDFTAGTGWRIRPEGACRGEICVPLPDAARPDGDLLDVRAVADVLGMPVLEEPEHGIVAVGPSTVVGRALESAVAPELVLPDVDGNPFDLSSLHGRKVLLVAWASW